MIHDFSMSRRQVLLTGTAMSLALAMPALASNKQTSHHLQGIEPMTSNFVTTKDGVEIYF